MVANKLLLRRRDHVVAVGEHVRQALVNYEGFPQKRVRVVYNGVDLEQFDAPTASKDELRKQLGLPSGFLLVQVARLHPYKDHATAIRTVQRLATEHPDIHLVIVGDGEERTALKEQIAALKLYDRVHLVGLQEHVAPFLHAADAFLLTSISEGIPLTLIEAMAGGIPCVSTNVGGVAEVVEDGQSGLLAAAGDDAALASQISKLVSDRPLYDQLVQAGRDRARQRFSSQTMHEAYHQLYASMLARE